MTRVRRASILVLAFAFGAMVVFGGWSFANRKSGRAIGNTWVSEGGGELIDGGRKVSLDEAQRVAQFPIYRPSQAAFGMPTEVWIGRPGDPTVSLRYPDDLVIHLHPSAAGITIDAAAELVKAGFFFVKQIDGDPVLVSNPNAPGPSDPYVRTLPDGGVIATARTEDFDLVLRDMGSVEVEIVSPTLSTDELLSIAASLSA